MCGYEGIVVVCRPASSKLSGSTESLKMPIKMEKNAPEKGSKIVPAKEVKDKSKSSKKTDSNKKTSQVWELVWFRTHRFCNAWF